MKLIALGTLAVLGSGYTVKQRIDNADKPVELRVEAATEGIVTIFIPAGDITIEGWRNDEIEIIGTLNSDDANLVLMSDHGHAELRLLEDNTDVRAKLNIRVPKGSNLDIETTSADLTVTALDGVVRFESVDGSLSVEGAPRGVVARSVTGDIAIPAANVPGFAHSEEGTVRLGSGTGQSAIGRGRDARRYVQAFRQSERYEDLGEQISSIIAGALSTADFSGLFDYDHDIGHLKFDISGDLDIDLDHLEDLFDGVGDLLEDIEDEIGDEMESLGEELEELGDEIRRRTRHRARTR